MVGSAATRPHLPHLIPFASSDKARRHIALALEPMPMHANHFVKEHGPGGRLARGNYLRAVEVLKLKQSWYKFYAHCFVDPKLIRPDNAMRTNVVIRL